MCFGARLFINLFQTFLIFQQTRPIASGLIRSLNSHRTAFGDHGSPNDHFKIIYSIDALKGVDQALHRLKELTQ